MSAPSYSYRIFSILLVVTCVGFLNTCADDSTGISPDAPSDFHFLQDTIYAKVAEPVTFRAVVTGYAATLLNSISYGDNTLRRNVGLTSDTLVLEYTYLQGGTFVAVLQAGDGGAFLDTCVVVVEGGYHPAMATTVSIHLTGVTFNYNVYEEYSTAPDTTWQEMDTEFIVSMTNTNSNTNPTAFVWNARNVSTVNSTWRPDNETTLSLKGTIEFNSEGTELARLQLEFSEEDTTAGAAKNQYLGVDLRNIPLIQDSTMSASYAKFVTTVQPSMFDDTIKELLNIRENWNASDPLYRKRDLVSFTKETPCTITVEFTE